MRFKSFVAGLVALCLCVGALPALLNAGQAAAPYYITVDVTNQIVTVYENGNRTRGGVVRQMICSTGKSGHSTPLGTFTLPYKTRSSERTEWYYFSNFDCYAKWATRITGPYLFHSVIYSYRGGSPTSSSVRALGSKASHGCVRLRPDDAKWIARNCGAGTQVRIYYSGDYDSGLRARLLKRSFYRGNESYYSYLGLNTKIPLKMGSGGTLVKKLQTRLRALGFFPGVIGGNYLTITETAVRNFQKAAGMKQNGVVSQKVWNRIFAGNAPTGTCITLSKGMSGPAVSVLQRALKAAKCYNGTITGKFDDATVKAVKKWEKVRGYKITGKAVPTKQRKLLAVVKSLRNRFGDQPYKLVTVKRITHMARVSVSKAGVYEETNTKSAKLLTLKKNAEVKLLAEGEGWLEVQSGDVTGYMKETSVTRFDDVKVSYRYQLASEPAPKADADLPRIEAPESNGIASEDLGWAVTRSEGVAFRAGADEAAPILAAVPANTVLCVLGMEDGWIRITWQGDRGYIDLGDVTLLAEGDPLPEIEAEPEAAPAPEAESAAGVEGLSLAEEDNAVIEAPTVVFDDDAIAVETAEPAAAEDPEIEVEETEEIAEGDADAPEAPEAAEAEPSEAFEDVEVGIE